MPGPTHLILLILGEDAPSKVGQARVLVAILGIVIILLAALAVLTLVRRLGRRATGDLPLAGSSATSRPRRIPRSAWAEAGKRARPVDELGNLPDDDAPREKDDLEETH